MAQVHRLDEIRAAVEALDLLPAIEEAFVAYSEGRAIVPPVGELIFQDPPGDAHIKYGHVIDDDVFVIKVATGFYDNPRRGLPGNSGLMLVFSATTGFLLTVLLDEGYLTNVRTALAGAVSVKWLARRQVDRVAVFGTGLQARMQVEALGPILSCRRLSVWGRRPDALASYRTEMESKGYEVHATLDPAEAARGAGIIITTTAAESPILDAAHVEPGTHIVAMGSDTPTKNELSAALLGKADVYVADSLSQCSTRGELHHAIAAGTRRAEEAVELGKVITTAGLGRTDEDQITIADLTGVAVQDIAIAKSVCAALAPSAATGAE